MGWSFECCRPPSRYDPPDSLAKLRGRDLKNEEFDIPESPENRKCTDVYIIIPVIAIVIVSAVLTGLSAKNGDLRRALNGYDDCLNICEIKNDPVKGVACSGKDMRNTLFSHSKKSDSRSCVPECTQKLKDDDVECRDKLTETWLFSSEVKSSQWALAPILIFGILVITGFILLHIFFLKPTIICLLLMSLAIQAIVIGFLWYKGFETDEISWPYLISAIVCTVCVAGMIVFMIFQWSRFMRLIELIRQAIIIIKRMPQIFVVVIVMSLCLVVVGLGSIFLILFLTTCGSPHKLRDRKYTYQLDDVQKAALAITAIAMLWFYVFLGGLYHMIVSISTAKYYFAKQDEKVRSPICSSLYIVSRFHLGSIGVGSLIVTIAAVLRALANRNQHVAASGVANSAEDIIRMLTDKAYIQIGLHGKNFWRSGVRGVLLLFKFFVDSITLQLIIGPAVKFQLALLVGLLTGGFGVLITWSDFLDRHSYGPVLIGCVTILCITWRMYSFLFIVVDTVFMCYCEDKMLFGQCRYAVPELEKTIESELEASKPKT